MAAAEVCVQFGSFCLDEPVTIVTPSKLPRFDDSVPSFNWADEEDDSTPVYAKPERLEHLERSEQSDVESSDAEKQVDAELEIEFVISLDDDDEDEADDHAPVIGKSSPPNLFAKKFFELVDSTEEISRIFYNTYKGGNIVQWFNSLPYVKKIGVVASTDEQVHYVLSRSYRDYIIKMITDFSPKNVEAFREIEGFDFWVTRNFLTTEELEHYEMCLASLNEERGNIPINRIVASRYAVWKVTKQAPERDSRAVLYWSNRSLSTLNKMLNKMRHFKIASHLLQDEDKIILNNEISEAKKINGYETAMKTYTHALNMLERELNGK